MIGFDMIQKISKELWAETGLTPDDVQVRIIKTTKTLKKQNKDTILMLKMVFMNILCILAFFQAIELHDCFAPNELITYEAIGLCPVGNDSEKKGENIPFRQGR